MPSHSRPPSRPHPSTAVPKHSAQAEQVCPSTGMGRDISGNICTKVEKLALGLSLQLCLEQDMPMRALTEMRGRCSRNRLPPSGEIMPGMSWEYASGGSRM